MSVMAPRGFSVLFFAQKTMENHDGQISGKSPGNLRWNLRRNLRLVLGVSQRTPQGHDGNISAEDGNIYALILALGQGGGGCGGEVAREGAWWCEGEGGGAEVEQLEAAAQGRGSCGVVVRERGRN